MKEIERQTVEFINRYNLSNKKILIAFSGGRDSVALFDLFYKNRVKFGLLIFICYVNHNLRGEDSNREEEFIDDFFKKFPEVVIFKKRINENFWSEQNKSSTEIIARNIRYDFFKEIIDRQKIDFLLTAHHFDDKIETFFINLFRAGGVDTLSSIKERRKNVLRPLLSVKREQINSYIEDNNLKFFEDFTNNENNFLRNKIRNRLIPVAKEINRAYYKSFFHAFNFIDEQIRCINKISNRYYKKVLLYKQKGIICIDKNKFNTLDISIKKTIIKIITQRIYHPAKPSLFLLNYLSEPKNRFIYEKNRLLITSKSDKLFFVNKDYIDKKIEVTAHAIPFSYSNNLFRLKIDQPNVKNLNIDKKTTFVLEFCKGLLPFNIRKINNNDTIIQNKVEKKIFSITDELKIPKELRGEIIVVDSACGIVGFFIFNQFRVSEKFYIGSNDNIIFIKFNFI